MCRRLLHALGGNRHVENSMPGNNRIVEASMRNGEADTWRRDHRGAKPMAASMAA